MTTIRERLIDLLQFSSLGSSNASYCIEMGSPDDTAEESEKIVDEILKRFYVKEKSGFEWKVSDVPELTLKSPGQNGAGVDKPQPTRPLPPLPREINDAPYLRFANALDEMHFHFFADKINQLITWAEAVNKRLEGK